MSRHSLSLRLLELEVVRGRYGKAIPPVEESSFVPNAQNSWGKEDEMVTLNITITGKIPREAAEWLLKLLMILADYFEFSVGGGFAEISDEQEKSG